MVNQYAVALLREVDLSGTDRYELIPTVHETENAPTNGNLPILHAEFLGLDLTQGVFHRSHDHRQTRFSGRMYLKRTAAGNGEGHESGNHAEDGNGVKRDQETQSWTLLPAQQRMLCVQQRIGGGESS